MRKTLLMLLLCAPLAWIACSEGMRLYNVLTWKMEAPRQDGDQSDAQTPTAAEAAKPPTAAELGGVKAIVELHDSVAAAIVRLEPRAPRDHGGGPLEAAIRKHAKERESRRKLVEDERLNAIDHETKIVEAVDALRGRGGQKPKPEDFRKTLEDYAKVKVQDLGLIARAGAEIDWPAVEKERSAADLEKFYSRLGQWDPGTSKGTPLGEADAEKNRDAYDNYVKKHEDARATDAKDLINTAIERRDRWRLAAQLAGVLEKPGDHPPRHAPPRIPDLAPEHKERLDQIAAIVELADGDPPEAFLATARQVLKVLCDDLLKLEPLDDDVLVATTEGELESRPRKDVQVILKGATGKHLDQKGDPKAFDEYTIRRDAIESIELPGNNVFDPPDDLKTPALKGTPYSQAIHVYNVERARLQRLSEPELRQLLGVCEPHASDLEKDPKKSGGGTLIDRINALLAIVDRHRNLFDAPTNP